MIEYPNVVTICPREFPGVDTLFRNMQDVAGTRHFNLRDYPLVNQPENTTITVFGGYAQAYEPYIRHVKGSKAIWIASSVGQIDLSQELPVLNRIVELKQQRQIQYVFMGSQGVKSAFFATDQDAIVFPYPFEHHGLVSMSKKIHSRPSTVGFFSPIGSRKNLLNQVAAITILSRNQPIHVYTNTPYQLAKSPNWHRLEWLPRGKYLEIMGSMHVNLQATWAESFDYMVAESMALGVPTVISSTISENLKITKGKESWLADDLVVDNLDDPSDIMETLEGILRQDAGFYSDALQEHIISVADKNNKEFMAILDQVA